MTAYTQIVIGVLSVTQYLFSLNLACTKITTSCPTAAQWLERGKVFNCDASKKYVCLMWSGDELREGCIFNSTIQAGRTGCPYSNRCDTRTGQPLLVTANNYLPCPPDYNGCPPSNHTGYSILEIYKYARCQGRNSSDERSVSPDRATSTQTVILSSQIIQSTAWIIISVCLALIAIFFAILYCRIKCKRSMCKDSEILRRKSSSGCSPDDNGMLPLLLTQRYPVASLEYSSNEHTEQYTPLHDAMKVHSDAKADIKDLDTLRIYMPESMGSIDTKNMLIKAQEDANAKHAKQNTPLHIAALNGNIDTLKKLIDDNADVNAKAWAVNTPLHNAASNGHTNTVKILTNAKADVNAKDFGQNTPLHKAASNGHVDTTKALFDAGADVNAKNWVLDTPLHMAASNGHIDTVKILIDAKADVNAKGEGERTPLHRAATKGDIDTLKKLLASKADVNSKDHDSETPLHNAARCGNAGIIRILLTFEADFTLKNNKGKTAEEVGDRESKQVFRDFFEKVPREIKRLGKAAIQLFLRSLNENAVPMKNVRCMFFGHAGAGKTTLVNSLLGNPRNKSNSNNIDLQMGKLLVHINSREWHIQDKHTERNIRLEDYIQVDILDFAEQMMFYTICHTYPSARCWFFLVFNACLGLDGTMQDDSLDRSGTGKILIKDYIEFWVTTITTYTQSNVKGFPKIAIVGTHIDQLTNTSTIPKLIQKIKNRFQHLVGSEQLIVHEDLFINASSMDAETTEKFREMILTCGTSYPSYGQLIPRSWSDLYERMIRKQAQQVIAFEKVININLLIENPLNKTEMLLCMNYLHSLGYLLFFPEEGLNDHIILDVSSIGTAMKCLFNDSKPNSQLEGRNEWQKSFSSNRLDHYMQRVMKKLDLISEPKVYNFEGFEENPKNFYIPWMIDTDISSNALSLVRKEETVQLSFVFNTIIPPAVYNRLVATSLSLWPVFDSHIYNGLIIIRSGLLHVIAFKRENKQIDISVAHLEDQTKINMNLCRTIVQFVEQRLSGILSIYNSSSEESKSLFQITYQSAAAKDLSTHINVEREDEDDEVCDDRCKCDIMQEASFIPDDLFLMRVALSLKVFDLDPLVAVLYNPETVADKLQADYSELGTYNYAWLILMEWSRQVINEKGNRTLGELRRVLNEARINSHILCKVMRLKDENPVRMNRGYLETNVHSELLHAVADRVSSVYVRVGLELGLKADAIWKIRINFKGTTVELIRAMLQEWYNKNKERGHVKVANLTSALLKAKGDISTIYEFEKRRNRRNQEAIFHIV